MFVQFTIKKNIMSNNSSQQPNQNPYTYLPNSGTQYQFNYTNYAYPYAYQYPPMAMNNQQNTDFHPENYMGYAYQNFTNNQPYPNSYPPLQPYLSQQQTYPPVNNYIQQTKLPKYCNNSYYL